MIDAGALKAYRDGTILANWDGKVSATSLEATRVTLRQLAVALIATAPDTSLERIGTLFVACVERFNELDMEDQFICTIEREDICEELYRLGDLCGVSDSVDEWLDNRDW